MASAPICFTRARASSSTSSGWASRAWTRAWGSAAWPVLGIGIGTLIRNQVAAILIGVFVIFLLQPLLTVGLSAAHLDSVAKWLPTNASSALMAPGTQIVEYLAWWAGGLVLLGYALVLAALGIVLSVRRDIS